MAATNYTPIQLYHSTTASAVPVNTNLVNGELAINITDGKLYYKDNGGTVQVIASKGTGTIGGSTTQVQYNLSGALAGSSNFTFNGTTATINTLNLTNALGATYGGTAQSSWTTGDLLYASGSNTLAKLGIGLNTYILTSNGSIPGWAAPSAISVNTATNLAGGAAGSVPYQSGAGATTFLSIGTANQVVTSTGSAPQWSSGLSITTLTASDAVTFSATTQNIALGASQTSGTFTVGGTAQTGNISIDRSTKTHTLNIGTGITESGQTKTINIGTAGDTGSTTAITIGSTNGTTITINGTVNASTLDLTNLEVTNIKAKDGTASMTLADTTGIITLSATAGTANGVLYLNGSRAVSSGSALTFDGTTLGVTNASASVALNATKSADGNVAFFRRVGGTYNPGMYISLSDTANNEIIFNTAYSLGNAPAYVWQNSNSEQMRLTSTGLHLGTTFTSISNRLQVAGNAAIGYTAAAPTTGLIVAGNVGIGTDSPGVKLEVSGSATAARISGLSATVPQLQLVSGGVVNWSLRANNDGGSDFTIFQDSTQRVKIDSSGTLILRQSSNAANTSVSFNTTVQNALTLDSSGNLGLGVMTPNERLDVLTTAGRFQVQAYGAGSVMLNSDGAMAYKAATTGHRFFNASTQAMTLDASGNLGIGVTSPGTPLDVLANSSAQAVQIRGRSSDNNSILRFQNNAASSVYAQFDARSDSFLINAFANIPMLFFTNNTERVRITSGGQFAMTNDGTNAAPAISFTNDLDTGIFRPTTNQLGFATAGVQAMTLTADGKLGIGTTTPPYLLTVSDAGGAGFEVGPGSTYAAGRVLLQSYNRSGSAYTGFDYSASDHKFLISGNERARITSGGYFKASDAGTYLDAAGTYHEFRQTGNAPAFWVSSTNASLASDVLNIRASRNTTNSTFYYITCYNDGGLNYRFLVADSGNVTNVNGSYGTISDAKMKTDIVDAGSQWSDIKALRFRKFKMKDDPSGLVQLGVVAQEVELTSPGLVDEHADRDAEGNDLGTTTKSVKTSVLLMKAAVALQEAMARIEQLEAKVAALEAK